MLYDRSVRKGMDGAWLCANLAQLPDTDRSAEGRSSLTVSSQWRHAVRRDMREDRLAVSQ
jgi:hypothetical protein